MMNEKEIAEGLRELQETRPGWLWDEKFERLCKLLYGYFSAKVSKGLDQEKARESAGEGVCGHEGAYLVAVVGRDARRWCRECGALEHVDGEAGWTLPRSQQK